MFHPELLKWLSGNVRAWVAGVVLLSLWAFTDQFLIGLIGGAIAYFRLGKSIEELLGRAVSARASYAERRFSFEDREPVSDETSQPRYSAPPATEMWAGEDEEEVVPEVAAPPPAPASRPMSSVKVPPRKPVDLPRRR